MCKTWWIGPLEYSSVLCKIRLDYRLGLMVLNAHSGRLAILQKIRLTSMTIAGGGAQCRDKMWVGVMRVALSREQLHRVIDDLPADKLPALADLIHTLIDEDDEPVGAEEVAEYRRIRDEMRRGKTLSFDDVFPER